MKNIHFNHLILFLFLGLTLTLISSCKRDIDELEPADYPTDGDVFLDGFSAGLAYEAWGDVTAFDVDEQVKYKGTASMKFAVPDEGETGGFAGGRYYTEFPRDLSGYDALTFWAKASKAASINEIGFANEDLHQVTLSGIKVNTNWKKVIIPIPDPGKLVKETGLLYYSEGPEDGSGYTFWLDEVQFEKLGTIAHNQPEIMNGEDVVESAVNGLKIQVTGLNASFNLPDATNQTVTAAPAYYTFSSSDNGVASVDENGMVTVNGQGTAKITAKIGDLDAKGSLTINSAGDFVNAPIPTADPNNVISLFSDAYENVPVEYYNGYWQPYQTTTSADFEVAGDHVLNYANFNFVGIQFTAPTIDASDMTHLHVDIYVPNDVDPSAQFIVKVVDIGADGTFEAPNAEVAATYTSPDPLVSKTWISLDISLAGLATKANLAQVIFENGGTTLSGFYADNIYLYKGSGGTGDEPLVAAPVPVHNAADVISVFSDSYSNIDISELNPDWGQSGTVEEVSIEGNTALKYSNFNYQGTQFANAEDLSEMEFVHIDMWTSDATDVRFTPISTSGSEFLVGLTPITSGEWVSYDIPISAFTDVPLNDIHQMKFDATQGANPVNIWLDNIYFYKDGGSGPTEPTVAAPDPVQDEANVVSIFSDAYTDIDGTDFFPNWGQTTVVTTESIDGNNTLKYANFNYQGTAFAAAQDVSGMEFMHIDLWTADATVVLATPISESTGELLVSLEPIQTGQWNSYDIPLSTFTDTGMTLTDIFQLKFDGQQGVNPSNIWLDNIYFYKEGSGPTEPTTAAPDPVQDEANVVSVFSDVYTDIDGTDFFPNWGQTTVVTTESIGGNNTLKYANFNYQGTVFAAAQDVSGMEFMHIDLWTADATVVLATPISESTGELLVSLVPIQTGQWNSYDIPLSTFTDAGMTLGDIFQLKFDGQQGVNPSNIWLDNIYFYKTGGSQGEWNIDEVIDFESTGFGAGWGWNVFENDTNPPLEFVANPDPSGANTSATVAKITALQTGQPWAGCETQHGQMGTFSVDAAHSIVKIMVYKSVISDVGIKLVKPDGWSIGEIKVANTLVDTWEELTFDFSSQVESGYDQIVVFPDFDLNGRPADHVIYFDNIRFVAN